MCLILQQSSRPFPRSRALTRSRLSSLSPAKTLRNSLSFRGSPRFPLPVPFVPFRLPPVPRGSFLLARFSSLYRFQGSVRSLFPLRFRGSFRASLDRIPKITVFVKHFFPNFLPFFQLFVHYPYVAILSYYITHILWKASLFFFQFFHMPVPSFGFFRKFPAFFRRFPRSRISFIGNLPAPPSGHPFRFETLFLHAASCSRAGIRHLHGEGMKNTGPRILLLCPVDIPGAC